MKSINKILSPFLASTLALSSMTTIAEASFTDVGSSHWANSYISIATTAQLVEGVGNSKFLPDKEMTYGEFAVVIVNGAYEGKYVKSGLDSHWADPYLNVLMNNKLF